jgi:uroporphyrinogen-III synthase
LKVLVLRPEPGASETLFRARERGLDAVAIPLFEVEPVDWQTPNPELFDGLLLTSANAVRRAGNQLRGLRSLDVYAVGEATADAARRAGFEIAVTGTSGVEQLLGSISPDLKLLHLCGEERKEGAGAPQRITPIAVYRSKAVEEPDLTSAQGIVALVHSPRAARRFAELAVDRRSISIAAISQAAAEAAGSGWRKVAVATQPTDDALLALAAGLCNNRS